LPGTSREMKVDAFWQAERPDSSLESAFFHSKIPEGSHHHVAADAGEAIEIENAHRSQSRNLLDEPTI
jgi:hypothetical protein